MSIQSNLPNCEHLSPAPGGRLFSVLMKLSEVCCALPERVVRLFAASIGLVGARVWLKERIRLYETIDRVYHRMRHRPPKPIDWIIDQCFLHFALFIGEMMRFPVMRAEDFKTRVIFEGLEHLQKALAAGTGVILVVPHLGNWEVLGGAIAHLGFPLHSFYMAQKEDDLGLALDHFRQFTKMIMHDRDRGLAAALKALKNGAILGMLPDQDGGNHGIYMDFLGHWVSLPIGPANWSLKTGAAVVPLYNLREGRSSRFKARFFPALPDEESGGSLEERIISRTKRIVSWMEDLILAAPHQYLWFYDRFKSRHHQHMVRLKMAGLPMRAGQACIGRLPGDSK